VSLVVFMYLLGCVLGFLAGRDYEKQRRLREEAQEGEAW